MAHTLLKMTDREKNSIMAWNVIGGTAKPSGAASFVASYVPGALSTASVVSCGVLGVVGAGYGVYSAKKEIEAEQKRIVQIKKELFVLMNLAADELKRVQETIDSDNQETDCDGNYKTLGPAYEKYKEYITIIRRALHPTAKVRANLEQELHKTVLEYSYSRKTQAEENALWGTLTHPFDNKATVADSKSPRSKNAVTGNICYSENDGESLSQAFIDSHNTNELEKHFYEKMLQEKKNLKKQLALLKESKLPLELINSIEGYCQEGHYVESPNGQTIPEKISALLKSNYGTHQNHKIIKSILTIAENMLKNESQHQILASSHIFVHSTVFEENGSFSIFLNAQQFEKKIKYKNNSIDLQRTLATAAPVLVTLFSAGNGFAAAIIMAVGSSAVATGGISLIVLAAAILITGAALYFYRKCMKAQDGRLELRKQLQNARTQVVTRTYHDQDKKQPEQKRDADSKRDHSPSPTSSPDSKHSPEVASGSPNNSTAHAPQPAPLHTLPMTTLSLHPSAFFRKASDPDSKKAPGEVLKSAVHVSEPDPYAQFGSVDDPHSLLPHRASNG